MLITQRSKVAVSKRVSSDAVGTQLVNRKYKHYNRKLLAWHDSQALSDYSVLKIRSTGQRQETTSSSSKYTSAVEGLANRSERREQINLDRFHTTFKFGSFVCFPPAGEQQRKSLGCLFLHLYGVALTIRRLRVFYYYFNVSVVITWIAMLRSHLTGCMSFN